MLFRLKNCVQNLKNQIPFDCTGRRKTVECKSSFAQQLLLSGGIIAHRIPFEEYSPSPLIVLSFFVVLILTMPKPWSN